MITGKGVMLKKLPLGRQASPRLHCPLNRAGPSVGHEPALLQAGIWVHAVTTQSDVPPFDHQTSKIAYPPAAPHTTPAGYGIRQHDIQAFMVTCSVPGGSKLTAAPTRSKVIALPGGETDDGFRISYDNPGMSSDGEPHPTPFRRGGGGSKLPT